MQLNVKKFQEGGPVGPTPEAGPAPEPMSAPTPGPENPERQIMQLAQQIAQQIGDPNMIRALAEALMQIADSITTPAPPAYQMCGGKMVRIR